MCDPRPPPRQKVPNDGPGPKGYPDCYYTSRTLNSSFRYANFVKKLRKREEEERVGALVFNQKQKDHQSSNFFIHCDRKSLINNVARRVNQCLASYEIDLKDKRQRLYELFKQEEEANIRKFAEQALEGREAAWQEKKDRLQYLIEKRKKEHEEKFKEVPIGKCPTALGDIYKRRAKDIQLVHLYQIKEKRARNMAEQELENMWHEIAMKESDALIARLEYDAIERARLDMECKRDSDKQLEEKRQEREKERERLKQEVLWLRSVWDQDNKKEEEKERQRAEKQKQTAIDRAQTLKEREEMLEKLRAEEKTISDTWNSLTSQGLADERADQELRKLKEQELVKCNQRMIELKQNLQKRAQNDDNTIGEVAKKQQEFFDKSRCQYLSWAQKTNRDVRQAMIDQIKERAEAKDQLKKKLEEQDEYQRQIMRQMEALSDYRDHTEMGRRKKHQNDLLQQIEYNKLLKERARQEELDQIRKFKETTKAFEEEINKIIGRPDACEHPFSRKLGKKYEEKKTCPCTKPNYCNCELCI